MKRGLWISAGLLFFHLSAVEAKNTRDWNLWSSVVVNGHLSSNPSLFYQMESHMRLSEGPHTLRQNLERFRFGQHLNPHVNVMAGYDFVPTQTPREFLHEQRLWQQVDLKRRLSPKTNVTLSNRLEQRWVNGYNDISLRDRIKFHLTWCREGARVCPNAYSETFINLNTVAWDGLNTLSQQWLYAGAKLRTGKKTHLNVGYINQHLWSSVKHAQFDIFDIQWVVSLD